MPLHPGGVRGPGADKFAERLEDIRTLANLRNTLTTVESGVECDRRVRDAGFLTHTDENCEGKGDADVKRYVLNMLDTVVNGFLEALSLMTDKNEQVPDFLRKFDGACVEAKGDNVQEWLARAAGIGKAARSEESHDLAYSVIAEFNAIAEEVKKPFADAARAACEAGIRAQCEAEGITDEQAIQSRIETKVQMELLAKEEEIAPLVRAKLEGDGRLALYEALAGAKRPLTEIARDDNGRWTVTTVTDSKGKPVMKSVSGMDIDRDYQKFVDLFMEDAISMGMVEYKTRVDDGIAFATREDLRAEGVLSAARRVQTGNIKAETLKALVKEELAGHAATVPDDQFDRLFEKGLSIVLGARKEGPDATRESFRLCVKAHASAAYFDKTSDLARLAHLVAHSIAANNLAVLKDELLDDLDGKASRFAYLLQSSRPDSKADIAATKANVVKFIRRLVGMAFPENLTDQNRGAALKGRQGLSGLQYAGTFFFDRSEYDLGHRAAGRNEIELHKMTNRLMVMARKLLGNECLPFIPEEKA